MMPVIAVNLYGHLTKANPATMFMVAYSFKNPTVEMDSISTCYLVAITMQFIACLCAVRTLTMVL